MRQRCPTVVTCGITGSLDIAGMAHLDKATSALAGLRRNGEIWPHGTGRTRLHSMGGVSVHDREFEESSALSSQPSYVRSWWCARTSGGPAEDLAQDAFLALLRHWGRVERHDRPGAWVRRVAIRKAVATHG
jgi:sigma-70-like protein